MKKNIILLLLAKFFIFPVYSQLKSPAASPKSKIYQEVGLVEIRIDYSRPSKKGREIFGGLVPLNKIWRTGANSPTTIFFSEDVKVNNKLIKGGEYHIYSVPSKSKLDLVIYSEIDIWDFAAGLLICQESGVLVTGSKGKNDIHESRSLLAAKESLHKKIITQLS